ncbi:MAG: CBS domain-containing protein [Nanoarchaeota archaeon]|nr:CBS domain-containing protein [Nanoarchaeota archaeon]
MVYFSDLQKKPVLDKSETKIGRFEDVVFIDGEEFAEITHLIYKSDDGYLKKIPWKLVDELKEEQSGRKVQINILLDRDEEEINPAFVRGNELTLGDILDKQLVDVDGVKVVRVNDIILGKIEGKFCVAAVAVGMRSMVRRLGFPRLANLFTKKTSDYVIRWDKVETLGNHHHDIHVKIQKKQISDLHSEDIADIMEDLDSKERALIFKTLNRKKAVRTLIDAEPRVQESFFKSLRLKSISEIIENIPASHAADLLGEMPKTRVKKILSFVDKEHSAVIREILHYPEATAGAIMHTNMIIVPQTFTAQQTIALLRRTKPATNRTFHLYVTNRKKRLLGVIPLRSLITASPKKKVSQFMQKDIIRVHLHTTKEEIAKVIARYDLFTVPVVDDHEVIQGVVTADEVLTEIMPESWKRSRLRPLLLNSNE